MSTIHLHQTTTATPEQFVAGLTDFGPGRSKLFGRSADDYLEVHDQGPARRRHRGLRRHLGTPALRLVGSQPRRPDDHRLQCVGRRLGPHLHPHAAARRDDRRGRRRGPRRQELQGTGRSGSCSGSSASASWERRLARPSRPSKPATTGRRRRNPRRRRLSGVGAGAAGQTVLVIGGSAGIGLETARRARAEGADVILTARDPARLEQAGLELGAPSTAAFDATDFDRLARFFDELPEPIDHVLVTGPGPYYAPLAEFDVEKARRDVDAHLLLPMQVARSARGQGARRRHPALHGRHRWPPHGAGIRAHRGAHRRASGAGRESRARARADPRQPDRGRIRGHAAVGIAPRRPARRAPGAAPRRRCRSGASSAPPTSPRSPST